MPLRVFMAVSNDNIGGRGRLRRPEIVLQQEQTSVINTQFIAGGVIDTGEQFIAGVNDTGDDIFPRCR